MCQSEGGSRGEAPNGWTLATKQCEQTERKKGKVLVKRRAVRAAACEHQASRAQKWKCTRAHMVGTRETHKYLYKHPHFSFCGDPVTLRCFVLSR